MRRLLFALLAALIPAMALAQPVAPPGIPRSLLGQPNGVAQLGSNGAVPLVSGGTGSTTASGALAALGANNGSNVTLGTIAAARVDARGLAVLLSQIYIGIITPTQPLSAEMFQRDTTTGNLYGNGAGAVPVVLTLTQPATSIQYRVRDASSPATVLVNWTTVGAPLGVGTSTVSPQVPAGLHTYYLDFEANNDSASVVSTTTPVLVGDLYAVAGQSLAQIMFTTAPTGESTTYSSLGLTPSGYAGIFAGYANNSGAYPPVADGADVNYPPAAWLASTPTGTFNSAFAVQFTNLMQAASGVPIALIGYTVGGTGIASWLPGYVNASQVAHWPKLVNVLAAAGSKFAGFLWCQGHYESKDGNTAGNFQTQLQTLYAALVAQFPLWNGNIVIGTIPDVGSYGSGPSYIAMVRNTAKAYVASNPKAVYVDGLDTPLYSDNVHPSQAGNIVWANHWYRAAAAQRGVLAHGDKGPALATAATRGYGSAWIYIPTIQTNGGTAWTTAGTTAQAANQFQVFPAGATTGALALNATTPLDLSNPAQIGIQLATAPTEPASLNVWYRLTPDTFGGGSTSATAIYDNVTDGDGITVGRQLFGMDAAINASAPSYTITLNTPSVTTPNTALTITGTYTTSASPTAFDYSIDDGTTWVAASGTPSGGVVSIPISGGLPAGAYVVKVRDHVATSVVGTSARFIETASTPTLASNPGSLVFSWDASNPGLMFQDSALVIPAVNGSVVCSIADGSGGGNSYFQAGATTLCPVYQVNVKNGLPGLRFTGASGQFLRALSPTADATLEAALTTGANYFAQVVFTPNTLPSSGQVASDVFMVYNSGDPSLVRLGEFRNTGATYHTRVSANSVINNATVSSGAVAGVVSDMIDQWNGATVYNLTNALTQATASFSGTALTGSNSSWIGNYGSSAAYPFDGWLQEIRVYGAFGSTQNVTDAQAYSVSKWGS